MCAKTEINTHFSSCNNEDKSINKILLIVKKDRKKGTKSKKIQFSTQYQLLPLSQAFE